MKKYLLPEGGTFYKANLHCHSNLSDGHYTPEHLKEIYKERGYSILAITDHEYLYPHPELNDEDFLTLTGYEIQIPDYRRSANNRKAFHLNLFAKDPANTTHVAFNPRYIWFGDHSMDAGLKYDGNGLYERIPTIEGINAIIREARDAGFLVCYNHPAWSLAEPEDYLGLKGLFAMEIYNHSTATSCSFWDAVDAYAIMLRHGMRIACVAGDDNHNRFPEDHPLSGSFGGITMIKAESLTYDAVIRALENGDFYATRGPEIHELTFEDGVFHIKCSPAARIAIATYGRRGGPGATVTADKIGKTITEASFALKPDDEYIRFTVYDWEGKAAYTRAYYPDEYLS